MSENTAGKFLEFISGQIADWKTNTPVSLPGREDELNELLQVLDKVVKVYGDCSHGLGHLLDAISLAKSAEAIEPNSQWANSLRQSAIKLFETFEIQLKQPAQSQVHYRGLQDFLTDKSRQEYACGIQQIFEGLDRCFALSTELDEVRFGEWFSKEIELHLADILKTNIARTDSDEAAEVGDEEEEEEDDDDDLGRSSQEVISEIIQRSHDIRVGCEQVLRCMRELRWQVVNLIAGKPRSAKGEYNRRMLEKMQQDHACISWSAAAWAEFLKCSKSTVHAQASWDVLLKLREQLKLDRLDSQNDKR